MLLYAWVRHYSRAIQKTEGSWMVAFGVGTAAAMAPVFYDVRIVRDMWAVLLVAAAALWFATFRTSITTWIAERVPLNQGDGARILREYPPRNMEDLGKLKLVAWAIFMLPLLAKLYWRVWT